MLRLLHPGDIPVGQAGVLPTVVQTADTAIRHRTQISERVRQQCENWVTLCHMLPSICSLACLHSLPPSLFLSLYSGRKRKAGGQGWGDGGICFILSLFALHLGFISGQWGGEVV